MRRTSIPLEYENQIKSLCWSGDSLIDYVGGISTIDLEGSISQPQVSFTYRFDGAIASADGRYAVIFEYYGTKAILLRDGRIHRELNRSFYCADAYEYPIAFVKLDTDSWGIVHCPDNYNVIEIESAETGERLTKADRKDVDFFQSRLSFSPKSRWLLSAGWIWHPLDSIMLYDLSDGFENPRFYSGHWEGGLGDLGLWEISNAVFLSDDQLLVSGSGDHTQEDGSDEVAVGVYDLAKLKIVSRKPIIEPTGELMPIDDELAVGFYQHPKLLNYKTGQIEFRWDDIKTDKRNGSISFHDRKAIIAVDIRQKRFAVATPKSIEIVFLSK